MLGCGQLIYNKAGKIIDIEGNPESPINEGRFCPKGANAFQLAVNPHRVTQVLYRAPYSDHWETRSLDWALDQIARRIKATKRGNRWNLTKDKALTILIGEDLRDRDLLA